MAKTKKKTKAKADPSAPLVRPTARLRLRRGATEADWPAATVISVDDKRATAVVEVDAYTDDVGVKRKQRMLNVRHCHLAPLEGA